MVGQDQSGYGEAGRDQLEIIGPDGQITFYDLDWDKGITNIGRDPNNDLVVDSPGVGSFHAVIDHRQRPYQIMLLSTEGDTRLCGQPLPANVFQDLNDWDTLEIDGHSIVLFQAAAGPAPLAIVRPPSVAPRLEAVSEPVQPAALPAAAALPRDQRDELILTEVSAREWTLNVEQTAACLLTIVNGGNIVATFSVDVEGVPRDWVTIVPPRVNLNEGARATVSISITPPRLPSSRAGSHPLVITVTSPNYPGHASRTGATLIINPFFAFTVGEISPKQQTVSWRKPTGQVTLPITNDGNSEVPFRVDGEDEERHCRFEFGVPGEGAKFVRQAEVRLQPEQTLTLPIDVTPFHRRLIGLRKRNFSFTVTTSLLEGALAGTMPRSVLGRLSAKPLIGPVFLLLMLLSLAALVGYLGKPAKPPVLTSDRLTLSHGGQVTLTYDASRFPTLSPLNVLNRQNELFLNLTLQFRPEGGEWRALKIDADLPKVEASVVDVPIEDGHYQLLAQNWLSNLIPSLAGKSREVPIDVEPVDPRIVVFRPSRDRLYVGEEVVLVWTVNNADSLVLSYDDAGAPVEEEMAGADLEAGRRTVACNQDTTFTLVASNASGSQPVRRAVRVIAMQPPVPTPVIVRFDVEPLQITLGEAIRIGWAVTGADQVTIKPLGEVPMEGEMGDEPQGLTTYQLIASKTGADGTVAENQSMLKEVIVNPPPTPTLAPEAPVIDLFEAVPKEVIAGEEEVVELTWSVLGDTTSIEITFSDQSITGLAAQDVVTVTVNETTLFVLTASNGELKTSKAIEIKALEPTPTPKPTDTPEPPPTPEPTPTPFPPPIISYFTAEAVNPAEDRVTFKATYSGPDGPYYVYEVQARSHVKLSWGVKSADVVILENLGPQPPEGELELPDAIVSATTIKLTAANNDGQNMVYAYLEFQITAPPPPPPPSYVTGSEDKLGGTNTLIWAYADEYRDRIDGFRIYRAEVPPGTNYVVISPLLDPAESQWIDQISPTCGLGYYVVAVYTDPVSGAERETAASLTSWYSRSCE